MELEDISTDVLIDELNRRLKHDQQVGEFIPSEGMCELQSLLTYAIGVIV